MLRTLCLLWIEQYLIINILKLKKFQKEISYIESKRHDTHIMLRGWSLSRTTSRSNALMYDVLFLSVSLSYLILSRETPTIWFSYCCQYIMSNWILRSKLIFVYSSSIVHIRLSIFRLYNACFINPKDA